MIYVSGGGRGSGAKGHRGSGAPGFKDAAVPELLDSGTSSLPAGQSLEGLDEGFGLLGSHAVGVQVV